MNTMMLATATLQEVVINTGGEVITGTATPVTFSDLGFIRWPITFCALMVVILSARATWRLKLGEPEQSTLARPTIDGGLFWGGYAMVLGILGTVVGLMVAASAIEAVGRVETPLVWGGVKVALSSTVYGFLVFLVAALVWFALRHWHRRAVLGGA